MGFKVRYLERGRETGHELISGYETAKTVVENFAAHRPARSAEVIDSDGKCVFRRPRVMKAG